MCDLSLAEELVDNQKNNRNSVLRKVLTWDIADLYHFVILIILEYA